MADELPSSLEGNNPANLRELANREGHAFANFSEAQLVGLTGFHGHDRVRAGAAAELLRLNTSAIRNSSEAATKQGARLVTLSEETSKQTHTLIVLTRWIIVLTVVLGVIAMVQLWVMLKGGA